MTRPAPPPLNALRAFEAFARHGGMTAAAAELCVTHGAVSRQVRTLQETLGVVLVTGPRHRLTLTAAGNALARSLSGAFVAIDDAVATAKAGPYREIDISCLGTFALKWLIPRLPGFLAAHPEVRVRMSESYAPADFKRDRIDGAIRIREEGPAPRGQEVTPFLDQQQGLVVAPHLIADDDSIAAIARLPRLHSATFRESWTVWSRLMGLTLPPAPVEREFGHNHSMVEAVAAGLGAAIAPWAFVAPDVTSGRLAAPFSFIARPTSRFVFLRPAGRKDAAVDAFRDWLVEQGQTSPLPTPWTGPDG
ncbi:LysR family transcriptional regulator [soil metagenome]